MRPGLLPALVLLACAEPASDCAHCVPYTEDTGTPSVADTSEPPERPDPPDPLDQDLDGDGWTVRAGDCDDEDADIRPDAEETCDQIDNNCNGLTDEGLPVAQLQSTDYGADGVIDNIVRTIPGPNGRTARREVDSDADGIWDVVETYAYEFDAVGRLSAQLTDVGDDGTIDSVREYVYDANGRLVMLITDNGGDGVPDRVDHYFYNDDGQRVRWEMDSNGDGNPDAIYYYTYDPHSGMLVRMELERMDATGVVVGRSIYVYEYTPFNRSHATWIDTDGDGDFDTATLYFYDANQMLVLVATDAGADGTHDSETTYKYDARGAIEVIEIDNLADGAPDTRILREETCY